MTRHELGEKASWHELCISFNFDSGKEGDEEEARKLKDKVTKYAQRIWKNAGRGYLHVFEETNEGIIGGGGSDFQY